MYWIISSFSSPYILAKIVVTAGEQAAIADTRARLPRLNAYPNIIKPIFPTNDSIKGYWTFDTVGTKENPAYTSILYKYNKRGYLIDKDYKNSLNSNVLDGLYVIRDIVSEEIFYSKYGLYDAKKIISSKILKYGNGEIETHYYKYENDKLVQINIYNGETLYETKIYKYIFYSK